MVVRQDSDGSLLEVVTTASRAVAVLTVPWSVYALKARAASGAAAERLAMQHPALGIEFFSLDEDAVWCQRWLAGLGVPQLGNGYSLGAGSILWLELGRPISFEIGGAGWSDRGIVARSLFLWEAKESGT